MVCGGAFGSNDRSFQDRPARYFMLVNWFKVPFSANLGLINAQSLQFNLVLFPLVALGALAGVILLKRIPEKIFNHLVQGLAALAAVNLLV